MIFTSPQFVHQGRGDHHSVRIPERHGEQPRPQLALVFQSKRVEAELRAQSAKLLATRLHTHGVGGECIVSNAELAGNKTKRYLRDRLARAQQAARVTERAELQRETELVGVAAAALYGGEIGDTQGPVPDHISTRFIQITL